MAKFIIEKFYLFFEGIMVFQVIFFSMAYFIAARRDVLYYCLLNLLGSIYFFLNAPDTFLGINENIVFNSSIYLYTNFAIFLGINFTYVVFLKEIFNDTVEQYPHVKKLYSLTFYSVLLLYFLFVVFSLLGWHTNIIFYTGHLINGPFCTLILIYNFRTKGYKALMIAGMIVILTCALITLAFTIRHNAGSNKTILERYPLAVIKLGMFIDIILFQLALLRRWKDQEKELAVQQLKSQLAVEKIRNQISRELHDDIGATLSGINMYSFMAQQQSEEEKPEEVNKSLIVIQQSAKEMITRLKDIVWSVKPVSNSIQILLDKLEEYALVMAGAKNISVTVACSPSLQPLHLPLEQSHNLYMICKEAINNAVKYSSCSKLILQAIAKNKELVFSIADNGQGFDINEIKRGSGLNNMEQRAAEMNATFNLQSEITKGTIIEVRMAI